MKLTREQAYDLILRAYADRRSYTCVRFAQALWNQLPMSLAEKHVGTKKDFFFIEDDLVACDMFFEFYVEEEDFE